MKRFVGAFPFLFLLGGIQFLQAQGANSVTQFDFWNLYSVRAPIQAQDIVVDPADDSTWYVASNSGLYITRNGGTNWNQVLTDPVNREAIAIDPANSNRIYVGAGASIYISVDHGITWGKLAGFSQRIASVFISPTDGSIFVGPRGLSGVYRSLDQGASWSQVSYGASFAPVANTWDLEEDGSGWLWAATEAQPLTPGKMMLLRSADRGASWVDVSGALTAPPSKLMWDGASGALYAATNNGIVATGNQGARWVTYVRMPALTLAIAPLPSNVSATPGLLAGLDVPGGGGVAFAWTILHRDVIDPSISPSPSATAIGPAGISIQALALNNSRTRFYAVGGDGEIYVGTVMRPQLNPAVIAVTPGGALRVACQTCPIGSSMSIVIGGKETPLLRDGNPPPYGFEPQRWDVPASMPFGVYPAQLTSAFATISFTVVVISPVPTITTMTSVRFVSKAQYALGEVVSLFGTGLTGVIGRDSGANSYASVPLPKQLAQSQVFVDGTSAPLYYAFTGADGGSQINLQIPYSLQPGDHALRVNRLLPAGTVENNSVDFPFTVAPVSPVYIGDQSGGVYVQNNTQGPGGDVFVSPATPARAQDVGTIYATGLGVTAPSFDAGSVPPLGTLAYVAAPVSITCDDGLSRRTAEVLGAVASPQYPGLYQIAFRFPADMAPTGSTIKLIVAVGVDTQTFTVNFSR